MTHSKEPSEIQMLTWCWIRCEIENKISISLIPLALKHLIKEFTQKCIVSKIKLTIKEDLDLINILKKKLTVSIKNFTCLYRGSENNFECTQFHESFNGFNNHKFKGNFILIQSTYGNIFGGYTSKCWNQSNGPIYDPSAFLYLLRSTKYQVQQYIPLLFDLKKEHIKCAIYCHNKRGPIFGNGWDIFINNKCNARIRTEHSFAHANGSHLESYYNDNIDKLDWINQLTILGGGTKADGDFDVREYEVFAINI